MYIPPSWLTPPYQDKSLEKTNVKIDWNKFVDEDEDEVGGECVGFDSADLVRYFLIFYSIF